MTTRANSLTERVTKPAGKAQSASWTMPANELRVLTNGLTRLGYNSDALLVSAALHEIDLDDADVRIPCEAIGALVSHTQQQRFTPNLALELARLMPIGAYPLLDYLVVTSDTVGAGVRQLARYFRLSGNPVVITVHEDADPIRVEMADTAAPFSIEYVATLIVLHLRNETDGGFAAAGVAFRHRPDNVSGFEQILGCRVEPTAAWNGVSISLDMWRVPLRRRDPVLRHVLEARADDVLARLPTRAGVALEVQRALTALVAGGDTRIEVLARRLAMSRRTLQRRLAAEGVSYQELLEDTRKEAAERYISQSTLAIGEVAYLVGYSEPAPFHRAFKRWFGMTPEAFRQKQRAHSATHG